MLDTPATAEGDLARTPFAHLLVYAADRRLTGVLFLKEPSGIEHVVRLARGAAVKVRPGDRHALLGEMLVEAGAVDEKTVGEALKTQGLLGDVLLLAECVDRNELERIAERQFVRRMVRLFALPKETSYRYCEGHDELCDYGGEPASVDPLALLWSGLRAHGEASAMMDGTLGLLADKALRLHGAATVARFGLDAAETELIEHLGATPCKLGDLVALDKAPETTVRRLAYALVITRQIDLGAGGAPVGSTDPVRLSATLARMQLRSQAHRDGAAAPDPPGAGERSPRTRESAGRAAAAKLAAEAAALSSSSPPSSGDAKITEPASSELPPSGPVSNERPSGVVSRTAGSVPAGLSPGELLELASSRFAQHDLEGAVQACAAGALAHPERHDFAAFSVWVRASMGGADVKALSLELDDLLRVADHHVQARFYRAMLRKRLGDSPAMVRDLTRVLELSPDHVEATRELAAADVPAPKQRVGFLRRLFKR